MEHGALRRSNHLLVVGPAKDARSARRPGLCGKVLSFEKGWIDLTRIDIQVGTMMAFIEGGEIVNTVIKSYE